jgi:flagellar hook assembly protein FlgD
LVRVLERGVLSAGRHSTEWNGTDSGGRAAPSGRYFLRLWAAGSERTLSFVRLR